MNATSEQSLRDYCLEIKRLLGEGEAGEAASRAQSLLQRFPHYWIGHRLLAEAALEQGKTEDAIQLFGRVLSIDPEDFAAHTDLATLYGEEADFDRALWHMARAFEMNPGVREVREELRHLYQLRDGRAPGRLPLTHAAPARYDMREGRYDRAIEELHAALEGEPDRADLLVALAEAQWRAGMRQEAVRTADVVLAELPHCLKCNLIVGEFYAQEGDSQSADRYLSIAQRLDPENEVAAQLFGSEGSLQPRTVPVARGTVEPRAIEDEGAWRSALESATYAALAAFKPDWRAGLLQATNPVLAAWVAPRATRRPRWRRALHTATVDALIGEVAWRAKEAVSADAWHPPLRTATEHALGHYLAARSTPHAAVPGEPVVPVAPSYAGWLSTLRAATLTTLSQPTPVSRQQARPAQIMPPWALSLRQQTQQVLAATVSQPAAWFDAGAIWVSPLHEATTDALTAAAPLAEIYEEPAPAPVWATRLKGATDEALAMPALEAAEPGEARPTLSERLAKGAGELLHQVQEVADAIREKAADALAPAQPAVEPVAEAAEPAPATMIQTSEMALGDELTRARRAWMGGQNREAFQIFHRLYLTGGTDLTTLSHAIQAWTATDSAPALTYHLLGDLYRRMGRMEDALAQYREAINRI
ncbi:MAG: tetratricopeptide repeat protein [Ardenticatenaceae bacterium]